MIKKEDRKNNSDIRVKLKHLEVKYYILISNY